MFKKSRRLYCLQKKRKMILSVSFVNVRNVGRHIKGRIAEISHLSS